MCRGQSVSLLRDFTRREFKQLYLLYFIFLLSFFNQKTRETRENSRGMESENGNEATF
jgi:hypothetical protein